MRQQKAITWDCCWLMIMTHFSVFEMGIIPILNAYNALELLHT